MRRFLSLFTILVGLSGSMAAGCSSSSEDATSSPGPSGTPGIIVEPTSGLTTTEAGGSVEFSIRLQAQPTASVTIALSSSDASEGLPTPATITFTPDNWNAPQKITVKGVDDDIGDGNVAYTIVTSPAQSEDARYNGMNAADVSLTNMDNETAGIMVSPTSGLTTTEGGGTATFFVVLNTAPTGDVTVPLSSGDVTEGTVSLEHLIFTKDNWNAPQAVTVVGVDDADADGPQSYSIAVGPAQSTDSAYDGLDADDVTVTNFDNETAGITVSPTAGLTTSENGGTATFTIVLNAPPAADVTIGLSSSDDTEGTVSPTSLTFTPDNWNAPQTVTVTGVDDAVQDGNQVYTIVTAPAASSDSGYNGLDADDVTATNVDDETPGITVKPTNGLTTTESGGQAEFTIALNSEPTAEVTIDLTSTDTGEGTVSPASVTFTTTNWNAPQTVTVTGVDDDSADGNQWYWIETAAAVSTDTRYNGIDPADVKVVNEDNDGTGGVTVNPTTGLTTTEEGDTASFTVVLDSEPTGQVVIPILSKDTTEGIVHISSLVFTPNNWNVPQQVTVTGVDDLLGDGDQSYVIALGQALSTDPNYNGLDPADVQVTNTDDDSAGIAVTPTSGLITTESGGTASFQIVLSTPPTDEVTVALSSSDPNEGTVSVDSVTFTPANWNTPQTITVTGVDDSIADGPQVYAIHTDAAVSNDPQYNGIDPADVEVTNTDNDVATIKVQPLQGLVTTEAGGKSTFTIVLGTLPTAEVTIPISSSDPTEGTVSANSVTFTTTNWNTPQTITVTGVDDFIDDGDQAYTIVIGPASSTDTAYHGINPSDVSVTNKDNDSAGVTVTPTSGLTTTEAGGTATFTIVLTSEPTANVSIGLSSSDTTEGTVSPTSVTFTPSNWNVPQTVTVTGVDDNVVDGDQGYTIVTSAATSTDPGYSGRTVPDVSVTNKDNDAQGGVTITPTNNLQTSEAGGTATFTVVLTSAPTANVQLNFTSNDPTEGAVLPASITFTPANWNTPQTVTIIGIDDFIKDGNQSYTIVTQPLISTDPAYNGVNPVDISVTNIDND